MLLLMRERPENIGLKPFGWQPLDAIETKKTSLSPLAALRLAMRSPAFWVLGGSFAICGASTNGLVGTHLIPACHDVGISEIKAANLLALMGVFDIVGTTASGWLTDRASSRYLLFLYYMLRGLSLMFLPHILAMGGSNLNWFAMFYGLDWIATVPPTVRLTSHTFGKENTGVIYGWIGACHQLGASAAALAAGTARTALGDYHASFWVIGGICFLTGFAFLFFRGALEKRRFDMPATTRLLEQSVLQ